ncbi:MAG: 3-hydroxyisobutyrate dehydrogenase [Pseudomonadota bacterium]
MSTAFSTARGTRTHWRHSSDQEHTAMAHIGFIGLGNMGLPMAVNLVKAGHTVRVFDLVPTAVENAVAAGAVAVGTAAEAATDADFLVSMLPAGQHVRGLYVDGETPLLDVLSADAVAIDCSTIDAATAQHIAALADARGLAFLDAPVSGGTAGAAAGTLSFLCGGHEAHFQKALPILEVMGKNLFHAGAAGAGQIAKACNNMLLSVLMTGTCEALNMGIKAGLDPAVLSDIMRQSSGGNWALNVYNPVPGVMPTAPASKGYQGGFMTDLMVKDLGLAMDLSQQLNAPVPMGSQARALYAMHKAKGNGPLDFSSVLSLYADAD